MWLSTRARITGEAHKRSSLPCQDYAERKITDECMVCIVADGASSALLGEIGASIAVESIKSYFSYVSFETIRNIKDEELIEEIEKHFQKYLQAKSNELMFNTKSVDYATTAAFITIYEKYNYYVYGIVGDCAIAIVEKGKGVRTVLRRNKSNVYNRPCFLTDNPIKMQVGRGILSDNLGFIITSDGCVNGGMVTGDNLFCTEIVHLIISNLSRTQNPEVWLEKFLQKNITKFTGDDLSMYVIYNEECVEYTEEKNCEDDKNKKESNGKKGYSGVEKSKSKECYIRNSEKLEGIMISCLFLILIVLIIIILMFETNRRIYGSLHLYL